MAIQHREILDQIQQVRDRHGLILREFKRFAMEREVVLGMKFRKGQDVRDTRTGKTGTIVAGYRRAVPEVPPTGDEGG